MKVREYQLMEDCVEQGIRYGISRAYKYLDDPDKFPSREVFESNLHREIMNAISEKFIFEGNDYEED